MKRWWTIAMLGTLWGCGGPASPAEDPKVEVEGVPHEASADETTPESDEDAMERIAREVASGKSDESRGPSQEQRDPQTETWIVRLGELLPGEFCKDGSFFTTCFKIDHAECEAVTARHYGPCVEQHRFELPLIRDSQSGRTGGEILGRCVGVAFQQDLERQGKFTNTAKCNDPSAW